MVYEQWETSYEAIKRKQQEKDARAAAERAQERAYQRAREVVRQEREYWTNTRATQVLA